MKRILNVAIHELGTVLRHRNLLVFMVILPFLLFWFFGDFMKTGVVRNLPVAIVDNDNSATSRQLIANLEATPELKVTHNPASKREAERLVQSTETYGFVIIPQNFERDLRLAKQPVIISELNNSLLIPAGLEGRAVRSAVGTVSSAIQLQAQLANGNTVRQAWKNLQPVRLMAHTLSNPYVNYKYYMVPGFLLVFLQIFVMMSSVYILGLNLKYDTAEKLLKIGGNDLKIILFGKLLPHTLWFFLLGLVIHLSIFDLLDYPLFGNRVILLLALFLLIVSTQAFALVFVATSNSLREAMTKGNAVAALSLSLSGLTFPIMGMPVFFQWFAQIFPFTHYFQILLAETQRNIPSFYIIPKLAVLMVMTVLLLWYGGIKYQQLLLKGKYATAA
ncbi:ABC transporter permease [Flagellimonas sp.]|uniref:ABC transporter permease n=1 Tax=Flagellimonas sp. TaxID=2058762 RepID=UPI003BB0BB56